MIQWFFSNWQEVARVASVGLVAYLAVVLLLRAFGKRTLTQLNAFDFIVTVALGSMLAAVTLNENVSIAEGLTGILVLMAAQYGLSALSCRAQWVQRWLASEPRLLLHEGEPLRKAMRAERITQEQLVQVIRMEGASELGEAKSMVLETNGKISVVLKDRA